MSARKFDIDNARKTRFGNVTVIHSENNVSIKLHETIVASFYPATGLVTLNSGGWYTKTTKTAMNTFLKKINSGYKVIGTSGWWAIAKISDPLASDYTYFRANKISFHFTLGITDNLSLPEWF